MSELIKTIGQYWTRRAPSYSDYVRKCLGTDEEEVWAETLMAYFPQDSEGTLRILDIGTGPGFFARIFAKRGYKVTAVDYSEGMLRQAAINCGEYADSVTFLQMDAHSLDFADDSFDVIVTRNLTWNLSDPAGAYADWKRVLRPGGVMLNFDANWYAYLFDDKKKQEFELDRLNVKRAGVEEHNAYAEGYIMEEISKTLPMGQVYRPQWDMVTLLNLGFSKVFADASACDKLWTEEERINNASTQGFLVCAEK